MGTVLTIIITLRGNCSRLVCLRWTAGYSCLEKGDGGERDEMHVGLGLLGEVHMVQ